MNPIGIYNNLDRPRIKKMLSIGLFASVLTGIGDFLLGYADETTGTDFATSIMSSAPNLTDGQMIAGSICGLFGIVLEGLAFFAIYRLMADASPKYAHIYRTGIIGYIWLAPVGCHLNIGLLNLAYKYLLLSGSQYAEKAARLMYYGFSLPLYILLILFWLPAIIIQFKAFAEGKTPYPKSAKWFNLFVGMIPSLLLCAIIGPHTALGAAIGTMFLSFGNAFTFGGLLAALPSEEKFNEFKKQLNIC